ncbi:conserved Plasmodium protein, unknown function [Plasmodium gallinaceum]|uniref:Uncharacterized protein n=1 Tax=Plasmodium gallinaceum TaxID=5849 RepID=A0A1J1GMF5_PLAGA|nr:conserved Plasmodium protein, unknown function [Plasmodium gallinaceum]CRG93624.1 conserved Plasmodium protein, unknown function [Plasmodium gallinaceum]
MKYVSLFLFLFFLIISICFCVKDNEQKDNALFLKDNNTTESTVVKNKLINEIKKKSNEIRNMYNNLNIKNKKLPLYIFIIDKNEKKRQMLKDLFLKGKLDFLQGNNTPFSKYYISKKNKNILDRITLQNKINDEEKFLNSLNKEDKKKYIKRKLQEYEYLRNNVNQLSLNIENKFDSLEKLMMYIKE